MGTDQTTAVIGAGLGGSVHRTPYSVANATTLQGGPETRRGHECVFATVWPSMPGTRRSPSHPKIQRFDGRLARLAGWGTRFRVRAEG